MFRITQYQPLFDLLLFLAPTIMSDPAHDGKKCGLIYNNNRLFNFKKEDATLENCKSHCLQQKECVSFSGGWNASDGLDYDWCIGCKATLDANSNGSIAYEKSGKAHEI